MKKRKNPTKKQAKETNSQETPVVQNLPQN